MAQLTVKTIQAAKPRAERYELSDGGGLSLRVAPNGAKNWYVRFSLNGKQRPAPLRPYGDAPDSATHYTLAEARAKAAEVVRLARSGIDFREIDEAKEREERAQREAANERATDKTVNELFDAWFPNIAVKRGRKGHKDGGKEWARLYDKYFRERIGLRPLSHCYGSHVRPILTAVANAGHNRQCVILLILIKQMFRWGGANQPWKRLLVDADILGIKPEDVVTPGYDPKFDNERTRALDDDEVTTLADLLPASELSDPIQAAVWLMMSCGTRVGETVAARWEHVNLAGAQWFIPRENTKTQEPLTVFLSPFARRQFETLWAAREALPVEARSPFVFPGGRDPIKKHLGDRTIGVMLKGRQLDEGEAPMPKQTTLTRALALDAGQWKCHDLRRTCATMMQALGVAEAIAHRCLNHARTDTLDRVYLQHDYVAEMADAWNRLGAHLDALTNFAAPRQIDARAVLPLAA